MRDGRVGITKDDRYKADVDFWRGQGKEDGEDVVDAWVGVDDDLLSHGGGVEREN